MTVVYSKIQGGRAVLRFTANATVNVAANSTMNSDIADTGTANDQILGCTINQIYWSVPGTANVTIARGANTKFVLNNTDHWNFKDGGISMTEDPAATIVVTFSAAGGTVVLEVTKQYAAGNPPFSGTG